MCKVLKCEKYKKGCGYYCEDCEKAFARFKKFNAKLDKKEKRKHENKN